MPLGQGRYDDLCTLVRNRAVAECAITIIINGDKGSGFSVQSLGGIHLLELPKILRSVADEIESSLEDKAKT